MSEFIGKVLLNRFKVEEVDMINEQAFRATDLKKNKNCLIKMLPENLNNDQVFMSHFLADIERMATLQHPNLHSLRGAEIDDGHIYLICDYVNAVSLDSSLNTLNYQLPEETVKRVILSLCEALEYLHNQGFVYYDLRPANILVEKTGRIMLRNLGITLMDGNNESLDGKFITPVYLAPEQIDGFEVSAVSNIYSLGVIFYEILTKGRFPFSGERVRDYGSKIENIIREKTIMPPVPVREFDPEITLEQEAVLMKCLALSPENRYQSIPEFRQAYLDAFFS